MKKITNSTHLEGLLFAHKLEVKVSGPQSKTPGTEFISGSIEIQTDDEGMNVVPVNFRYVTAKTKAGKDNATYATLLSIIKGENNTVQGAGAENALKLKVDTATGLNDFYGQDEQLVSYKINDGGFVHVVNAVGDNRNSFEVDMLITSTIMKEADVDNDTPAMLMVKGATFNFMGSFLPIELAVKNAAGMKYFEGLDASASNPVFLKVWGHINCTTVDTQTTEESAFGEPSVKTSTRKFREWEISGASTETYDFGDEAVMTTAELTKAIEDRNVYLAEMKKKHDDWAASKKNGTTAAGAPAAPVAAKTGEKFVF